MIAITDEMKTKVGIKLDEFESQMIFKCDLGNMKVKDCYIDEEHRKEVDMLGPNPSRMLALGVLGCLSASFIFCLKKRNFKVDDFVGDAEVSIAKNEKGFWRIKKISFAEGNLSEKTTYLENFWIFFPYYRDNFNSFDYL